MHVNQNVIISVGMWAYMSIHLLVKKKVYPYIHHIDTNTNRYICYSIAVLIYKLRKQSATRLLSVIYDTGYHTQNGGYDVLSIEM